MIRVIKLRLKLSDFIDTDLEKIIMERIKAIENDLEIRIILYFWLGDENIDLKSFYEISIIILISSIFFYLLISALLL